MRGPLLSWQGPFFPFWKIYASGNMKQQTSR